MNQPKILVLGDVMLDHDRIGQATRLSPEAPVPVLLNPTNEYRLGGAGAVAAMCAALGAEVSLLGVYGDDDAGETVRGLSLSATGVTSLLQLCTDRRTTTKQRIYAADRKGNRHPFARLDSETTTPIDDDTANLFGELLRRSKHDAIIVSDYGKGVCTPAVVQACINTEKPVFVDPVNGGDWGKYNYATCIVPNRHEANGRTSRSIHADYTCEAVALKLDEDGCEIYWRDDSPVRHGLAIPADKRCVRDVTGCGDQFIATLALARCLKADWPEAAKLANRAAGLQVARIGAVPVTREELEAACLESHSSR